MDKTRYDIIGLGSAIVDIISYKQESFLKENGLPKGSMKLVDIAFAEGLYKKLGAATECSGGCCANTISGYGLLGGSSAFIGKTKQDYLGKVFKDEIKKAGVDLLTNTSETGISTSKCIIIVTEEEITKTKTKVERTMATYLDFDVIITPEDIDEEIVKNSKMIFIEGYLFDGEQPKAAIMKAIDIAKANNTLVGFTLSDSLCVQRHREEFLQLVVNNTDFVFGNESEVLELFQSEDLRKTLHIMLGIDTTFCVTKGESGSTIIRDGNIYEIDPVKVDDVYDVTGAGDLYASGFLFGYLNGYTIEQSGKLASMCASEVIKDIGGRPVRKISDFLKEL